MDYDPWEKPFVTMSVQQLIAVHRRKLRELCDLEQFLLIIVHGGGVEEVFCDDDDPHLQW